VLRKLSLLKVSSALLFAIVLWATAGPALARYRPQQYPQSQIDKDMQDRQMKEANKKRQQDIRGDTDKLLQLATELKAAVDKSNENLLSLDVVRKAEEVEKLAHRVKEKMKESVGPPQKDVLAPPPRPADR